MIYFFLLLSLSKLLFAYEVVGVVITSPRGGYGDIASNLRMVEKLAETYPNMKINVYGEEEVYEKYVKVLSPEIIPNKFDPRKRVNYISFNSDSINLAPSPQAIVKFSSPIEKKSRKIPGSSAALSATFLEYSPAQGPATYPQIMGESLYEEMAIRAHGAFEKDKRFFSAAAGINEVGLYISPKRPRAPYSPEELRNKLLTDYGIQVRGGDKIAFAYTHQPYLTQMYLKAMFRSQKDSEQKIHIFTSGFKGLKIPSSDRIRVYSLDKTPMKLNESLIAHASFPVLITGDVSLTMAIEHEKAFLYESLLWKNVLVNSMVKKLTDTSDGLGKKTMITQALNLDSSGYGVDKKMIERFLTDESFSRVMESRVKNLRNYSLPKNFVKLLRVGSFMIELQEEKMSEKNQIRVYNILMNQKPNSNYLLELSKALLDSNKSVQQKLSYLAAILNYNKSAYPKDTLSRPIKNNIRSFLMSKDPVVSREVMSFLSTNLMDYTFSVTLDELRENSPRYDRWLKKILRAISRIPTHNKDSAHRAMKLSRSYKCQSTFE